MMCTTTRFAASLLILGHFGAECFQGSMAGCWLNSGFPVSCSAPFNGPIRHFERHRHAAPKLSRALHWRGLCSKLRMADSALETKTEQISSSGLGAWLPVHSQAALADLNPTRVTIANRNLVVWRDTSTGKWSVQADVCPHRLAPLSQGRIDESTGCIECPYHGWRFDSEGTCTTVPQLDEGKALPKTSVQNFPTHVTGDLIWAFFPTEMHGESFPISLMPEDQYPVLKVDKLSTREYYVRELPYSWDFVAENFMDPAHIPFAHHSLQAVRSDGSPIPMQVLANNFTHVEVAYQDKIKNKSRDGIVSMQRPAYYHFRTKRADGNYKEMLKIFMVPVRHGRSRVLFVGPGPNLPTWLKHAASNRFLNTDTWLHDAERVLRSSQGKKYFNPSSSDKGAIEFRKWWTVNGLDKSPPHTFGPAPLSELPEQSRAQQTDVWTSHTAQCSTCRRVATKCRLIKKITVMVSGLSLILLRSHTLLSLAVACVGLAVYMFADKALRIVVGEVEPGKVADRSVAATAPTKELKAQ